ncbi:MAG TPA: thiolase family protein [Candidatus Scatomorpha pullistercoris]|uniref:Acetyl-CoA acetyltransferase n=1 Tax=Candidatus Scatomorpha pullistercoris TaxID=2840929 RepID=A0A9D1G370_9FIRM|nr:thiolase family protein [Candidatus Scatomorpha pullistercoris]
MDSVVIVEACRTAVGKFGGTLKPYSAGELASAMMSAAISRAGISPELIDEVDFGQCRQSSDHSNIARYAALKAGIPDRVPGNTVMCACASGMLAVRDGMNSILLGQNSVVLTGGVESMSNAPYYVSDLRWGLKAGDTKLKDSLTEAQFCSQPEDIYGRFNMGMTAENIAERYGISRSDQDEFALRSQQKAAEAIASGRFRDEIVPLTVPQGRKKPDIIFDTDEFPRETSMEALAKLKPAFREGGSVTAGNSSGRNDGASALLLMSERRAAELGLSPLARIRGISNAGVDPRYMGLGPVGAVKRVMEQTGLGLDDMQLIELNEAFASQSLACIRELGLEERMDIINVNGGAIALGHPIGSSGSRIIVTLIHEMKKRGLNLGLATLCVAGGMGMAAVIEMN